MNSKKKAGFISTILAMILMACVVAGCSSPKVASEDDADIEVITDEEEAIEAAEILFMAYEGEYDDTEVDLHMIEVVADNEYDEYYIVGNGFNPVYADECIEVRYGDEYDEYIFLDDDYMTTYYKIVDDGTQVVVLYASTYEEIDEATIEDGECCGSFDL